MILLFSSILAAFAPFTAPLVGGSDTCGTPDVLAGVGSFVFDNTSATTGTEGQSQAACLIYGSSAVRKDVWFSWVAPLSGLATISTCGTATADTKIAAYAGQGCPVSPALACNDDACTGFQSTMTFNCTAGSGYTLQIGLYPNNPPVPGGAGQITIHVSQAPANDECANAIALTGAGPFAFDNGAATTSTQGQSESICIASGQSAIAADQWFTWTPSASGTATLDLCNGIATGSPDEDTKVAIYSAGGCPSSAAIACNDDSGCGVNGYVSNVTWTTTCGATYLIQLGRFVTAGPIFGTFTLAETGSACPTGPVGYCFGDGSGVACPCGNSGASGRGCANSIEPQGARITAAGNARISADTLTLQGTGMPNATSLFFQGTSTANGGLGLFFGDGLRCAAGAVTRFGTQQNMSGNSQVPAGATPISVMGHVTMAGHRYYQVWYRNADPSFCTPSTFNLSNGLDVLWAP